MADSDRRATSSGHAQRERVISALAAGQSGYVSHAQLIAAGLSHGGVTARLRNGRYVAVHRGVYGVVPLRLDLPGLTWAAVLACGPGAVASFLTAAALWEFIRHHRPPLHVTAPSRRTRPGIITHRCATLAPHDITHQRSVPVTSRARTLLDIAPLLPSRQLRRIVNDHARTGALRLPSVADVVTRHPRHPGAARLAAILADTEHGLTASGLEDEFLQFVKRYGLPIPVFGRTVNGVEVDAYYPAHDLIIELDTTDYHGDVSAFERDRERDATHLAHGTPTLRITGERLDHAPVREAARLQTILDARAPQPKRPPRPERPPGP